MKHFSLTLYVGFLLTVPSVAEAQQSTASIQAKMYVEQAALKFVAAYDAGNAEAVAALWTPDGEYILGQQTAKGRPAIAEVYKGFFAAHPGSKMHVKIDSVRLLAPNVAIEEGTASVSNSANGPESSSSYSAIHVMQNGKWQMASVRESDVPLPPTPVELQEFGWLVGDWTGEGDAAKIEVKYDWIGNKTFLRGETTVHPKADEKPTSGGMQIIGKDSLTGQIVSWFFNADGGHGYGVWTKSGDRWLINTHGATAEGAVTSATNVIYHADENVVSWQSVNRVVGDQALPNTPEIVLERPASTKPVK